MFDNLLGQVFGPDIILKLLEIPVVFLDCLFEVFQSSRNFLSTRSSSIVFWTSSSALKPASFAICRRSARSMRSRSTFFRLLGQLLVDPGGIHSLLGHLDASQIQLTIDFGFENDVAIHPGDDLFDFLLRPDRLPVMVAKTRKAHALFIRNSFDHLKVPM